MPSDPKGEHEKQELERVTGEPKRRHDERANKRLEEKNERNEVVEKP